MFLDDVDSWSLIEANRRHMQPDSRQDEEDAEWEKKKVP